MNLKDTIEKKLQAAGVEYRFIPLPENIPLDIASHVVFHKIHMKDAVANIIYKTEKGFIAAQRRADTQVDLNKLKQLAGVRNLQFATKEELKELGTLPGTVPLTGLPVPFFVDQKVLELPLAYCGGGVNTLAVSLAPYDLVKLNNATVGDFTIFEKSNQMLQTGKRRILSGITPSGDGSLHIGNYLGAVKQFITLAKTHECFLMVADLHALTTIQNREQLQKNTETLILNELALLRGFLTDEEFGRLTFFRQSDVPLHAELQTILNNVTSLGLLKRAHAYKDKLTKDVMEDEVNMGLFNYPVLMAADILIYKPSLVPVGKDQKQHVEITRDIADRFNKTFKRYVFPLPEPHIPEEVAVILGTDGKRKMSKSLGNIISIFDNEETIKKQVKSTYTDPTRKHPTDPGHLEGNMVFSYLDFFGDNAKVDELKARYKEGKVGDVEVKEYLFGTLMNYFTSARKRYEELMSNPKLVRDILEKGAAKARAVSSQTMKEVREVIGLTNKYSFFSYIGLRHSGKPKAHPEYATMIDPGQARMTSMAQGIITIDDFARIEMRVGLVKEAQNVKGSEKLIRLVVNFGDYGERVIFTGVRPYGYTPQDFQDKQFIFATNLAPRRMLNEESQGMILAVDSLELPFGQHGPNKPLFVSAEGMPLGAKIR